MVHLRFVCQQSLYVSVFFHIAKVLLIDLGVVIAESHVKASVGMTTDNLPTVLVASSRDVMSKRGIFILSAVKQRVYTCALKLATALGTFF